MTPPDAPDNTKPWYEEYYDEGYFETYGASVSAVDVRPAVDWVIHELGLAPDMRVLDLGCGYGRHAVPLAERGLRVSGLDLSQRLLQRAREKAQNAGVDVEWVRRDMREIPWTAEFDAILSFYGSFGFFEDDAENLRVLEGVARALKPHGKFLISIPGYPALLRRWQLYSWVPGQDGWVNLERFNIDWPRSLLQIESTVVRPDGTRRAWNQVIRMFPPHELMSWFRRVGLEPLSLYGSLSGAPFTIDSGALVLTAQPIGVAR